MTDYKKYSGSYSNRDSGWGRSHHNFRRRNYKDYSSEQLLRDWYGEELAKLEIESQQLPTKKLEVVLDNVLEYLDKEDNTLLRRIIDHWESMVGSEIKHNAMPRRIQNGTLFVEVTNAAWRFQLERNFKPEILALMQKFTNDRVKRVKFVPGGKTRRI
jgi:hypothetical protein